METITDRMQAASARFKEVMASPYVPQEMRELLFEAYDIGLTEGVAMMMPYYLDSKINAVTNPGGQA